MIKENKKEQVENYLNELMESDGFTIDNLFELTLDDLIKAPQLAGIGKITTSTVLASYKRKYEEDFFKDIDGDLMAEMGETIELEQSKSFSEGSFTAEETQILKKMIQERAENQNAELIELKLALKNAGIDYQMLLKDYRTQKEIELKEWEESSKY
ncbi:hypothetical protein KJ966_22180 [bacterium]|nr:hypothetical protein [bacterium]